MGPHFTQKVSFFPHWKVFDFKSLQYSIYTSTVHSFKPKTPFTANFRFQYVKRWSRQGTPLFCQKISANFFGKISSVKALGGYPLTVLLNPSQTISLFTIHLIASPAYLEFLIKSMLSFCLHNQFPQDPLPPPCVWTKASTHDKVIIQAVFH